MREFTLDEHARPDFRGDEGVEPVTGLIEKQDDTTLRQIKQLLSLPFLLLMTVVAVVSFVFFRVFFQLLSDATGGNPTDFRIMASLSIGISIAAVDILYEKVAIAATRWENYRTQSEYESGLVFKTFIFRFINNNAAILWAAYFRIAVGDAERGDMSVVVDLASTVSLVFVSKNATIIALYIIYPIINYKFQHRAAQKRMGVMFKEAELTIRMEKNKKRMEEQLRNNTESKHVSFFKYFIDIEDPTPKQVQAARVIQRRFRRNKEIEVVQMSWHYSLLSFHKTYPTIPLPELWSARAEIVENAMMSNYYGLVNGYGDTMIQYSYVMMYSCVFPMAAFLSCIVNVLYIRFSVDINLRVVQRAQPAAAKNIGSWSDIINFLSYTAVLSNIGILHFTFGGKFSAAGWGTNFTNVTGGGSESGGGETGVSAALFGHETSELTEWFDVEFNTASKSLWALILLEHLSILAKLLIEKVIDEEPRWVREAIRNRRKLAKLHVIKEESAIDKLLEERALSLIKSTMDEETIMMSELATRHAKIDNSLVRSSSGKGRASNRLKALNRLTLSMRRAQERRLKAMGEIGEGKGSSKE
jgi:hypothetical protein